MITGKTIWRVTKAFGFSALTAYILLRAPYLYAQAEYFIKGASNTPVARAISIVPPTGLPLSKTGLVAKISVPIPKPPITNSSTISGVSATISMPKTGIKAPIVFGIDQNDFKAMYNKLNKGVVHYSATPKPGERGTAMIIGHSSDFVWKRNAFASIFALLDKLQPGDPIIVTYSDGQSYKFIVKQALIYDPKHDNPSKIAALENSTSPSLVLITCWPVNSTAKRYMVQAVME